VPLNLHSTPGEATPSELRGILTNSNGQTSPMRQDEYAQLLITLLGFELSTEILYRKASAGEDDFYLKGKETHRVSYNQLLQLMTCQGIVPLKRLPRYHLSLVILMSFLRVLPMAKSFCPKDVILLVAEKRLINRYNTTLLHASKADFWKLRGLMLESKELMSNLQMKIHTFKF
jgi:hypothetical protein